MLVYFEDYRYPKDLIVPYFTDKYNNEPAIPYKYDKDGWYFTYIGYVFVTSDKYSGPVFLLPKTFLEEDKNDNKNRKTLLGKEGLLPELIFNTEDDNNILSMNNQETFLPELSLWLFRAMMRFREDCKKEKDEPSSKGDSYREYWAF